MRKLWTGLFAMMFAIGMAACDVDKTEDGEAPDVDVQGGEMPEYDVDAADVNVGTDTQTVVVPDVDVNAPNDTTPR